MMRIPTIWLAVACLALFSCSATQPSGAAQSEPAMSAVPSEPGSILEAAEIDFDDLQARAEAGDGESKVILGDLYLNGWGVEADPVRAADLFREAVELGVTPALNRLALMTRDGTGMEADPEAAAALFEQALDAGDAKGGFYLGNMYREGKGVDIDHARALTHYERAALMGHPLSQYNLGAMILSGYGTLADPAQAYPWIALAARSGVAPAEQILAAFDEGMDDEQRAEARAAVEAVEARMAGDAG